MGRAIEVFPGGAFPVRKKTHSNLPWKEEKRGEAEGVKQDRKGEKTGAEFL
jgi:peptide subunit release factor 1 (eRF1)